MHWRKPLAPAACLIVVAIVATGGCATSSLKPKPSVDADQTARRQAEGRVAYDNEDWTTAEVIYQDLVAERPDNGELLFRLGTIYAHTERPDQAIAVYRKVLSLNPEHGDAWHNLAVTHLRQATHAFIALRRLTAAHDPRAALTHRAVRDIVNILSTITPPPSEVDP